MVGCVLVVEWTRVAASRGGRQVWEELSAAAAVTKLPSQHERQRGGSSVRATIAPDGGSSRRVSLCCLQATTCCIVRAGVVRCMTYVCIEAAAAHATLRCSTGGHRQTVSPSTHSATVHSYLSAAAAPSIACTPNPSNLGSTRDPRHSFLLQPRCVTLPLTHNARPLQADITAAIQPVQQQPSAHTQAATTTDCPAATPHCSKWPVSRQLWSIRLTPSVD